MRQCSPNFRVLLTVGIRDAIRELWKWRVEKQRRFDHFIFPLVSTYAVPVDILVCSCICKREMVGAYSDNQTILVVQFSGPELLDTSDCLYSPW